jgi:hypothetical protein
MKAQAVVPSSFWLDFGAASAGWIKKIANNNVAIIFMFGLSPIFY